MTDSSAALQKGRSSSRVDSALVWGTGLFLLVMIAGLFYVKWDPYYHKAFLAARAHSIGASIVAGKAAAPPAAGWQAARAYTIAYFNSVWQAVMLGLLIGSGVQVLLPRDWLARVLGRTGYSSTAIAGLASIPSMMCTCCAAPAAVGLGKSRASVGATLAYWLGNPILNPATMIFMGFVLGWNWVMLRILVGAVLVFGVAHWVSRSAAGPDLPVRPIAEGSPAPADRPSLARWAAAFWKLSIGLIPEYVIVVMALGAARAWLFPAMTPAIGHSLWLILLLAVTGTLFVIPTAGEVPIVQALMSFGLGTAGAGVLLTTLPTVSLPSLIMLNRVVPARVLAAVTLMVAALGLFTGAAAHVLRF